MNQPHRKLLLRCKWNTPSLSSYLIRVNQWKNFNQVPIPSVYSEYPFPPLHQQQRQFHRSPTCFAISIDVGYGDKKEERILDKDVSPAQRKHANLELEQMKDSTTEVLSTDPNSFLKQNTDAIANKVRVSLHYWTTRWQLHYHPISPLASGEITLQKLQFSPENGDDESEYGDYGARQASRLLIWILQMNEAHQHLRLVDKILTIDNNACFVNLMESFVIPCNIHQGYPICSSPSFSSSYIDTQNHHKDAIYKDFVDEVNKATINSPGQYYSAGILKSATKKHVDPGRWIPALLQALRILDIMNRIHEDPDNKLKPDTLSINVTLNIWSKLCLLLGYYTNMQNSSVSALSLPDWGAHDSRSTVVSENGTIMLPFSCKFKTDREVLDMMDLLLREAELRYHQTEDPSVKPDEYTYNTVVDTWARSQLPDSIKRIEEYLDRMERTEDSDLNHNLQTTSTNEDANNFLRTTVYAGSITYNSYLNAHILAVPTHNANSNFSYKKKAAEKVKRILAHMEDRYDQDRYQRKDGKPDTITYSIVLNSYANIGDAKTAEFILNKIIDLSTDPEYSERVQPNLICFNSCLNAWSRSKHPRAAENAEKLLIQMEEISQSTGNTELEPDTISYSSVISTLARSDLSDCGDRAEALLDRSFHLYETGRKSLKADTITFNSVLKAIAKQCQILHKNGESRQDVIITQQKAEHLLERMHRLRDSGDVNVSPGRISYNILLDLYAKTESPEKAEKLFQSMLQQYSDGNTEVKPDCISYNSFLFALSNDGSKENITKAENLLKSMEEGTTNVDVVPDNFSYNIMSTYYAKCRDDTMAQRAEDMLLRVEKRYLDGLSEVKPNTLMYNICINAWNKCNLQVRAEDIFNRMISKSNTGHFDCNPDIVTFSSMVSGLARSRDKSNVPFKAEKIIDQMEARGLKPNRYTYNSLINCWAKSGHKDAPYKAEEILLQMVKLGESSKFADVKPDMITFGSVINCWSQSKERNAAEHAQKILDLLEDLNSSGRVSHKTNQYVYSSVLHAWAKVGNADKALDLLNLMENKYKSGDRDAKPSIYIYNTVMNAIAKDNSRTSKAVDVHTLINRIIVTFDIQPTLTSYSILLNACAYTPTTNRHDREVAFKIARRCFKDILSGKHGEPNNIIFGSFLSACSNLIPKSDKRDRLMISVFEECCKMGLVDVKIIINLRKSVSSQVIKNVFKGTTFASGFVNPESIPVKWSENTKRVQKNHR